MRVVTVKQMKKIEAEAESMGISSGEMMERAGRGIAEIVVKEFGFLTNKYALGLIGSGNNGGDTLIALEHMAKRGWRIMAYLVRPRKSDDPLITRIEKHGVTIYVASEDPEGHALTDIVCQCGLILDGVLGTGFVLPLREDIGNILRIVKTTCGNKPVVAVDCPSGMDCDTGQISSELIPSKLTICLEAVKTGLLHFPAFGMTGEIDVVDLKLPVDLESYKEINTFMATSQRVVEVLPKRPLNAHKGTFGCVMLVAGSTSYTGAALLSGEAAYRVGLGLVQMAVAENLHTALAPHLPEAIWIMLPQQEGAIATGAELVIGSQLERTTAVAVGPGLGMNEMTGDFFWRMLEVVTHPKKSGVVLPLIIDADGLRWLATKVDWDKLLPEKTILTPHPGEMAILTGKPIDEIQNSRVESARYFANKWNHVVVLKGALTIVAAPNRRVEIIPVANPALARAGSGDVLTGMIAGLRAQGLSAEDSAVAGAWLHAKAGLEAVRLIGHPACVLARDIISAIPHVMSGHKG